MSQQQLQLPREHALVSLEFFVPTDATDAEIVSRAMRAALSSVTAIRNGITETA